MWEGESNIQTDKTPTLFENSSQTKDNVSITQSYGDQK
jgi:hypothetical protein